MKQQKNGEKVNLYQSLVIESDKQVVDLLADVLADVNVGVTSACNGSIADRILPRNCFDVIFMEPSLTVSGDINYFEYFCHRYPHLVDRTVLVTGDWRNRETMRRLVDRGLSVIQKPFNIQRIRELATAILEQEFAGRTLPAA